MMMMGEFLAFGGASCSLFAVVGVWKILRHYSCAGHRVKVIQMSSGRVMVCFGSRAQRIVGFNGVGFIFPAHNDVSGKFGDCT